YIITLGASFLCSPLKLFFTPPQWRGFCIQKAPGVTSTERSAERITSTQPLCNPSIHGKNKS
ncbi:hypothetical protein, partial [Phascolarctobacterium succinatutens]|uniref:hypothetical protein n=1 Tax=Phascolarctobacterium succinatutens TaxID=626940 RepID=UPI0026EABBC3